MKTKPTSEFLLEEFNAFASKYKETKHVKNLRMELEADVMLDKLIDMGYENISFDLITPDCYTINSVYDMDIKIEKFNWLKNWIAKEKLKLMNGDCLLAVGIPRLSQIQHLKAYKLLLKKMESHGPIFIDYGLLFFNLEDGVELFNNLRSMYRDFLTEVELEFKRSEIKNLEEKLKVLKGK